jgi:DNA-binding response OmpR family regulator
MEERVIKKEKRDSEAVSKAKIVILEDDPDEARITVGALEQAYECKVFDSLNGLRTFLNKDPRNRDEIKGFVIDLNLSDGDGFSIIPEIKKQFPNHPVIILSSRTMTSDKVAGFVMGVDDYVTKPTDPVEFLYRMNARINKAFSTGEKDTCVTYKSIRLDFQELKIFTPYRKEGVELSANETKLLSLLLRFPGKCFSRSEILEKLWQGVFVSDRTIDSHISHLRKKIKETDVNIYSVYGSGYKLV